MPEAVLSKSQLKGGEPLASFSPQPQRTELYDGSRKEVSLFR